MRKIVLAILILMVGLVKAQSTFRNVSSEEFKKLIDQKKYVLIDLRTDEEIKTKGMIKGAKQINFLDKNAESVILGLDKKKSYLLYCAGGGRSSDCADLMTKNGFTNIINLEKGFDEWRKKGFEIEKK